MLRARVVLPLVALVPITQVASAQPVDPYAPAPPSAPTAPAPRPSEPAAPTRAPAPGPTRAPAPPIPSPSRAPAEAPIPSERQPSAPVDPYAAPPAAPPANAPPPSLAQDPVLAERVAAALVARAKELLDGKVYLDAKQLAVEALVQSPHGASADQARGIIHAVNQQLGIDDLPRPAEPAKPAPGPLDVPDPSPIQDPTLPASPVAAPRAEGRASTGKLSARVHGGLYLGLLGATVGSFISSDSPETGAIPLGVAAGLAGALVTPAFVDKVKWRESQLRIVGSATTWGGVIGGLFGDIAKTSGTTAREVLVASAAGSTIAGIASVAFADRSRLTRGDVALVDTFAGIGAVGGLTLGMVMQPLETEAYSVNSVVGIAGGIIVGMVAAPQTDATPRRMARVAAAAAIGAAAPLAVYAAINDSSTSDDERAVGALASAGMIVGTYLGFRLTRGMDRGLDTPDGRDPDDAPVALVGRSSSGRWALGGINAQPLSRALAPQHGMALQLVGAAF